jgi:hypothetical protein
VLRADAVLAPGRRGAGRAGFGAAAAGGWPDVWRLYEDVCVLCAGMWFGTWRRNSLMSYSTLGGHWGGPCEHGDDDLTLDGTFMRTVGYGIKGRPPVSLVACASGFLAPSRHKHARIEGGPRAPPAAQPAMIVFTSDGTSNTRPFGRRVSAGSGWLAAIKVAKELSGSSTSSKPADADDADTDGPQTNTDDSMSTPANGAAEGHDAHQWTYGPPGAQEVGRARARPGPVPVR